MVFKVDDRVTVKGSYTEQPNDDIDLEGMVGTIKEAERGSNLIEFDEWIGGHNGDGNIKQGHGWWIGDIYLDLVQQADSHVAELKDVQLGKWGANV